MANRHDMLPLNITSFMDAANRPAKSGWGNGLNADLFFGTAEAEMSYRRLDDSRPGMSAGPAFDDGPYPVSVERC